MPDVMSGPPLTAIETVTDMLHGVRVVDPYRWLEDGNCAPTREWVEQQTRYAREYLDALPGRQRITERIREFLEVETCDSFLIRKGRYFFRKRSATQEQPCIYFRKHFDSEDQLLVDPRHCVSSDFGSVKPIAVSPDGEILAYEVREGGERTSRLEFVQVHSAKRLPERLPHGYLRAFVFTPDSQGFDYSIEPTNPEECLRNVLYRHQFGTDLSDDEIVFDAGQRDGIRVGLISGPKAQLIVVQRVEELSVFDYFLKRYDGNSPAKLVFSDIGGVLAPQFAGTRIVALSKKNSPNFRVVEIQINEAGAADFIELVPECASVIQEWLPLEDHIVISYLLCTSYQVLVFDLQGKELEEVPLPPETTVRLMAADGDEIIFECQSFFESPSIHRYRVGNGDRSVLVQPVHSLDRNRYKQQKVLYSSNDGTRIPMFLVGKNEVLDSADTVPAILTAYGGFQISMTPQFSVFVSFLLEKGCLFGLPCIRGGNEFAGWHEAAKRHNRQRAFDDFLSAARWLIKSGRTKPGAIGIFGGSNSGLLMGAAITQAPELFRAFVCVGPLLDMVRYHLFGTAAKWRDEYGSAEYFDDFKVLFGYSPYHRVVDGVAYPAVMMISGARDQQCDPLHARKMVARLQAATSSSRPILFDSHPLRGHSPVLPLSIRIAALTDRMAFLCDQLELTEREPK